MTSIAGISSRLGTFALGIQTSKGTAATVPTFKMFYAGSPSLKPYQNDARFAMTDGSRDVGDPYVSQIGASGDVPLYAHPDAMGLLWHLALGSNVDSGSTNFTHTATPANDLPWFTCWRMVGGVIVEKFTDCKISQMTLDGSAGSPMMVTLSISGITSTYLAADTALNPDTTVPFLFPDGAGALMIDAVAYPLSTVNLVVNNNLVPFQADGYSLDSIDPQGRDISGSFTVRFGGPTTMPLDYRAFFYGNDSGTTQVTTFSNHALDLKWAKGSNNSMEVQIPVFKYADIPVNPDPGGAVIEVQAAFEAERNYQAGVESAIMTVISKDQIAIQ